MVANLNLSKKNHTIESHSLCCPNEEICTKFGIILAISSVNVKRFRDDAMTFLFNSIITSLTNRIGCVPIALTKSYLASCRENFLKGCDCSTIHSIYPKIACNIRFQK